MKKLFALLLVAGLFTFASCGGDKKNNESGTDTAAVKDTSAKPNTEPEKKTEEAPAKDSTAKTDDSTKVAADTVKKTDGEVKDTTKK